MSVLGWLIARQMNLSGASATDHFSLNVFYYLYARNEPLVFLILLLQALGFYGYFSTQCFSLKGSHWQIPDGIQKCTVPVTGVAVFLITSLGTYLVLDRKSVV